MIVDFREFETFPAHKVLVADPEKISLDFDGVQNVESVEVDLAIQKAGEEFYCQGEVAARVTLECARCLALFEMEVNNSVDFIVCSTDMHDAHRKEALDDEDYVLLDHYQRADLTEIVRQAILLAVSLKPLCSEDCKGLCAQCGKNLNDGPCGCKTEVIDERWAALKKLAPTRQESDKKQGNIDGTA